MRNGKKTQKERIIGRLLSEGKITRNECLRNYITRLAHYINALRQEGWDFTTKEENGDYIYTTIKTPFRKVEYRVEGREETITKII